MNPIYADAYTRKSMCNYLLLRLSFFAGILLSSILANSQQAVSGIVTDYNGYWKTAVGAVNPVKPNHNHNLLAFTYNSVQYSTGVNDGILSSNGQSFVPGDFWSLPVDGISGTVTSNTKVGVGEMYDGVHNGRPANSPENDIPLYLTDGVKGLNIGTCIANLPVGTLSFFVSNINPAHIGDGIPDILVTQVADPSGSSDRYSLVDANNNIVGVARDIVFTSITPVANWTADFYEASTNPMVLSSGFTNTDRPVRLWAADLSDFGINQTNYQLIQRFQVNLSGNSDVAFAAYNSRTFNITVVLPVKLNEFSAKQDNGAVNLSWKTESEKNASHFIVEKSSDNINFKPLTKVTAVGNSNVSNTYSAVDVSPFSGTTYYRLEMVDLDGQSTYSKTVRVETAKVNTKLLRIYPNPAIDQLNVNFPTSGSQNLVRILTASGTTVWQKTVTGNNSGFSIPLIGMSPGSYLLMINDGEKSYSERFMVK